MFELRSLTEEEIALLYETALRRDFPPSELKSLSVILSMYRDGRYDVLGVFSGEELAAYALMYRPEGQRVVLLDYLAVIPQLRGCGVGTEFLAQLRKYYQPLADVMLIECERPKAAPDEELARKRIRFYTLAGAQLTNVIIWLFDVEYSILVLANGEQMPSCNWAELMLSLYRQMLPDHLYATNVRLIRA